jgi:hypothetical protein
VVRDDYLSANECAHILDSINSFRREYEPTSVFRRSGSRPLNYSVIDGLAITEHLPLVTALAERVQTLVNELSSVPLQPLTDERVAFNINITRKGGTYRWHYDRNRVTALVYLTAVEGGETECYPNFRIDAGQSTTTQKVLDRILSSAPVRGISGRRVVISPSPGKLVVMMGNRCLHSVRPVSSDNERINAVLSFDEAGKSFEVAQGLDEYLYEKTASGSRDPNYRS